MGTGNKGTGAGIGEIGGIKGIRGESTTKRVSYCREIGDMVAQYWILRLWIVEK